MDLGDPSLADDAIALRRYTADDIPLLVERLNGERDISYWTRIPWPYELHHAEEFLGAEAVGWDAGTDAVFAITDHSGTVLGAVGLHRLGAAPVARSSHLPDEVGYWLLPEARGRGAVTRAVRLVSTWGFDTLRRPSLNLQVGDGNDASRRVATRASFDYIGLVRASEVDDDPRDFHQYRRVRT